jgi:uncharacterized membrane protein YtjA (UPF0391 family)
MIPAHVPSGATVANSINQLTIQIQVFSGEFIELAIVFFVLALVAAALGARGVAGVSMEIARWFIILFIVLAVITLLL